MNYKLPALAAIALSALDPRFPERHYGARIKERPGATSASAKRRAKRLKARKAANRARAITKAQHTKHGRPRRANDWREPFPANYRLRAHEMFLAGAIERRSGFWR